MNIYNVISTQNVVDNTTNYTLTQTENRSCKVAVEGKQGSSCSQQAGCSPILTSTVSRFTPNSCRVGPTTLVRLNWQVTWAPHHYCRPQWSWATMGLVPTFGTAFFLFQLISLWEQFRAAVQLKSVSSIPILFCEDFPCFLSEALHFALRNTSAPLHTAQTRSWRKPWTHSPLEQLQNGWSSPLPSHQNREEDPLLLWISLGSLYLRMCLSQFWH